MSETRLSGYFTGSATGSTSPASPLLVHGGCRETGRVVRNHREPVRGSVRVLNFEEWNEVRGQWRARHEDKHVHLIVATPILVRVLMTWWRGRERPFVGAHARQMTANHEGAYCGAANHGDRRQSGRDRNCGNRSRTFRMAHLLCESLERRTQ